MELKATKTGEAEHIGIIGGGGGGGGGGRCLRAKTIEIGHGSVLHGWSIDDVRKDQPK